MPDDVEAQLLDEVERALTRPVRVLVGPYAVDELRKHIRAEVPALAARLRGGNRAHARKAATQLVDTIWPETYPPAEWWTTPLGFVAAQHYRPDEPVSMPVDDAGLVLDHTGDGVRELLSSGELTAGEDGDPAMVSVLAYLTGSSPHPARTWPERGLRLVRRAARRVDDWFSYGWHVPPGGTRTPRRMGVSAFVLAFLPPGVWNLAVPFGSWWALWAGLVVGLLGERAARRAGQPLRLPRVGWMLACFSLITGTLAVIAGLAAWWHDLGTAGPGDPPPGFGGW